MPYFPGTQQDLYNFKYQYSDVTDEEYTKFCAILVRDQLCYATHRNHVGKIATLLKARLKPNAKLQTQRPTKVLIHYRDKLKNLLAELETQKFQTNWFQNH